MPKLMSLLLAVLLICFTLNFCTKNSPTAVDISGLYSDTIRIKKIDGTIMDTVIFKQVIKIDDSTFKMCRFFCFSNYPYPVSPPNCDSVYLYLRQDNTIRIQVYGSEMSLCTAYWNFNACADGGEGFYDPSNQYLYLYHTRCFLYDNYGGAPGIDFMVWYVLPVDNRINPNSCLGNCVVERMKK